MLRALHWPQSYWPPSRAGVVAGGIRAKPGTGTDPAAKPRTGPARRRDRAAAPAAPEQIAPGATPAQPGDVFGENTTLTARPMIYVKGSGTWDKTFDIITTSLKKIKTYLDKEGIKSDGLPMTIFTASDDNGFDYEIGVPIAAAPKIRRMANSPSARRRTARR